MAGLIAPDELFGEVIFSYTLEDALDDGMLARLWEEKWPTLSEGKPIVATKAITETLTNEQLIAVWNDFAVWNTRVRSSLPEESRLFRRQVGGETVWVIEDDASHTILYPEDW